MNLLGRVALVTGGKRIGAVVAEALAARGADVALSYRSSREEAARTAAAVEGAGRRSFVREVDLSSPADCRALVDATADALGRLDVLINMASIYVARPIETISADDWQRSLAVDLGAAWFCSQAAIPHMRAAGGGRIVNFADWVAASGRPRYKGYLPYYVAKSAVIGLTEALALELASDNILVNAIAPGPIVPPPGTRDEEIRAVEEATPLGRWGGEGEIAGAILALLESDFITGETLRVDGGRHVK
jgi:NAD(P)-dependent dehydrogenase (short-subunit alcohol dehydrogenase family)